MTARAKRWLVRTLGGECMYCRELTLGALRFGPRIGGLRIPLCEPCHQRELPEVPHPGSRAESA